jgi:hypothetical protein
MPIKQFIGHKISLLCMIALTALATGCVNMSTLQTARTIPVDEIEVVTGGGYYMSPNLSESSSSDQSSDGDLDPLGLPYIEVAGRIGIAEYLDLGLKITLPGTIAFDVKYQLVDLDGLAMAAGFGLGYLHLGSGSDDSSSSADIIDIMVPLYISYHFNESFTVYGSPKYVMRLNLGSDSDPAQLLGAGGGLRIGNQVGVYLEATYMVDLADTEFSMVQVSAATFF